MNRVFKGFAAILLIILVATMFHCERGYAQGSFQDDSPPLFRELETLERPSQFNSVTIKVTPSTTSEFAARSRLIQTLPKIYTIEVNDNYRPGLPKFYNVQEQTTDNLFGQTTTISWFTVPIQKQE